MHCMNRLTLEPKAKGERAVERVGAESKTLKEEMVRSSSVAFAVRNII